MVKMAKTDFKLVPGHGIGLSPVYERLFSLFDTHPEVRPAFDESSEELLEISRKTEREEFQKGDGYTEEDEKFLDVGREANLFLRSQLEQGKIQAYVRDENTGEDLVLPRKGWFSAKWDDYYVPWAIWTDFVDPNDFYEPGPRDAGRSRPVYFLKSEFEKWMHENFASKKKRGIGRPKGSGPHVKRDKPLIEEMYDLIVSGSHTKHGAARFLASRAEGQSELAIIRRLMRRYDDEYLSD